jgi:hypothetical protein
MAKLWQDVISQPAYQKLDPDAKERVRQKYFNEVVTPQVKNPEQIEEYRQKFYNKAMSLEYPDAAERMQKNIQDQFNSMPPVSKEEADAINKQAEVDKGYSKATNLEEAEKMVHDTQRGVIQALKGGAFDSTTARYVADTFPDSAVGKYIQYRRDLNYEPETMKERVFRGIGAVGADAGLYSGGGKIAKMGWAGLGKAAPGFVEMAGAFGGAQGLSALTDIKEQQGDDVFTKREVKLSDVPKVALETLKGDAVGAVVGTAAKLTGLTPQLAEYGIMNIFQKLANKGIEISAETSAMLLAESVINGHDITKEGALETFITLVILKNFKQTEANRRYLEKIQAETGITPEQIAKNIHPEQIKDLANPDTAMKVIDEAKIKTEDQIKAEQTTRMQERIIIKAFEQNYKPGKTATEILQVNQIPKEYRQYVVDKVGENQSQWKPEVIEMINREIQTQGKGLFPMMGLPNTAYGYDAYGYEKFLPMPDKTKFHEDYLKDMERKRTEQVMSTEAYQKYKEAQARLKGMTSPEGKAALIDRFYEEEIAARTGGKRKYEHLPKVRQLMDEVYQFAGDVITPEERLKIAADPTTIDRYIDSAESGLSKLKPAHQKAVLAEIADSIQSAYNYGAVDKRARATAKKKAQIVINKTKHSFKDKQSAWRAIENTEANRPKSRTKFEQEKAKILREEYKADFEKIDNEYDQMRLENATLMQRAMGQAEAYKEFSHDNRTFYEGEHFRDMMEFSTKSDAEIVTEFNKAYFLKREFHQMGAHLDRFLNKSRFIANQMGHAIDRIFNKPIKQAMHNSIVETESLRKWVKNNIKTFDSKVRKEMGIYLVSLQGQGRATIQAMNDRIIDRARPKNYMKLAPEQRVKVDEQLMKKLDGKLIKVKELEQFTPEQQKAIKDIQDLMEVMFDRINSAREAAGLKPIDRVDDYFTFIRKFKVIEELGWSAYEGSKALFETPDIEQFHTKGFSSQFFKSRKDSYKDIEFDAGYVLDTYLASTIKACHMTPVIGKLRAGLQNAEKLALENPFAHKYLHDTLDYVSGKKMSTAMKGLDAAANFINRNIGLFILPFNIASAIIQPSALINTFPKVGARFMVEGLKDYGSLKMHKFAKEHSKELRQRMHDTLQDDISKGVTGGLRTIQKKGGEIGTWPLRFLDLQTATITWLSGYRLGMEKFSHLEPKAREREAIYFADDLVVNTQGSAARIDLAPIQHTPLGKSLTLFNTFVINNLNYYIDDIAGLRKVYKDGKAINVGTEKEPEYLIKTGEGERLFSKNQAVKQILMYTAAAAVANTMYELAGIDSPLPSPISAFYQGVTGEPLVPSLNPLAPDEKSRKEAQLSEGITQALCEFAGIFPVAGGSPRYGGASLGGAVWNLWYDTAQAFAGQPGSKTIFGEFDNEKVSDNIPYLAMKWAGVPGGQQIYKLLKMYDKVQKKEKEERKRRLDPVGYREREYRKAHPEIREREKRMKELRGR